MSDLKDKVELARKIILLNGADLRYDEVTSISDLLGDLLGNIEELQARVKELDERLHDAYAIYVGMDRFNATTVGEFYCLRIIRQIAAEIKPPREQESGTKDAPDH